MTDTPTIPFTCIGCGITEQIELKPLVTRPSNMHEQVWVVPDPYEADWFRNVDGQLICQTCQLASDEPPRHDRDPVRGREKSRPGRRIVMCDHGIDKNYQYIVAFEYRGYEVCVCECGALINTAVVSNQEAPFTPMTHDELNVMMESIMKPIRDEVDQALASLGIAYKLTLQK